MYGSSSASAFEHGSFRVPLFSLEQMDRAQINSRAGGRTGVCARVSWCNVAGQILYNGEDASKAMAQRSSRDGSHRSNHERGKINSRLGCFSFSTTELARFCPSGHGDKKLTRDSRNEGGSSFPALSSSVICTSWFPTGFASSVARGTIFLVL